MYIDLEFICEMIGWFIFIAGSLGVGIGFGSLLAFKLMTTKRVMSKMIDWSTEISKEVTQKLLDE